LKTPVSHTGEQSLGDVLEPALGVIAFDAPVAKDASAPQTHADGADLAQIIHTGGTEWLPKGATLAHDAVIRQYLSPIADGSVKAGDLVQHAMPFFRCAHDGIDTVGERPRSNLSPVVVGWGLPARELGTQRFHPWVQP
jgi:acyl-CoA synthetase (AMP-forming)/AMP-acid ligase II